MPIPNVGTPRRPFLTSAAHSEEVLLLESMLFCGCERALKNMIAQSNRVRSRHLHRAKLEGSNAGSFRAQQSCDQTLDYTHMVKTLVVKTVLLHSMM